MNKYKNVYRECLSNGFRAVTFNLRDNTSTSLCLARLTAESEVRPTPAAHYKCTPNMIRNIASMPHKVLDNLHPNPDQTREYAHHAERLGLYTKAQEDDSTGSTQAVAAKFVTAQDPIVTTANGGRLPAIPIDEAIKLNKLKDSLEGRDPHTSIPVKVARREARDGAIYGARQSDVTSSKQSSEPDAPLREAAPQSRTNPLFPPLPMYGPPTLLRTVQCLFFRTTSFFLSLGFLLVLVLGSAVTSVPLMFEHLRLRLMLRDPDKRRPFFEEEKRRKKARHEAARSWKEKKNVKNDGTTTPGEVEKENKGGPRDEFIPTEGGPDPLVCDAGYYAKRVGLDVETFDVQTEDGFIIELWHVFNPREYERPGSPAHFEQGPSIFHTNPSDQMYGETERHLANGNKKYPILMIHGLLQSAGAYCCTEEDSFAFYLAKSGYDVWLGNNRCGFKPRHTLLEYSDPRMWAWNIRQMGVLDLPALISRVLAETGFPKLALVAHSQGTTQTMVALAKEQRPELGEKISVFCALAPAAYAGPLIGKAYFKFMRIINPAMFRCIFGIHAFIPFMMSMHQILPARLYGAMGYRVFSFLFNWTDTRWEMDLRNRMFQFAPVYVSAESMRWWLGRECFAQQKCILATREEKEMEDAQDEEEDSVLRRYYEDGEKRNSEEAAGRFQSLPSRKNDKDRSKFAWYNEQFPPLALWVCGADDLVDGRRLLRRFDRGREPHVNVVHKKIIEGYEHLDVIWAMDSIETVAKEIKEVVWRTASDEARKMCRTPTGCEDVPQHGGCDEKNQDGDQHSTDDTHVERSAQGADVDMGTERLSEGQQSPVSRSTFNAPARERSDTFGEERSKKE